jgi:hypothetical protein
MLLVATNALVQESVKSELWLKSYKDFKLIGEIGNNISRIN